MPFYSSEAKHLAFVSLSLIGSAAAGPLFGRVASEVNSFTDVSSRPVTDLGCYQDQDIRTFRFSPSSTDVGVAGDSLTVEGCANACANIGYQFSGVEYSSQCFCESVLDPSKHLGNSADNDCNMPCNGDATELCGGPWRLNVYQTTLNVNTQLGFTDTNDETVAYLGCYTDSTSNRILPFAITSIASSSLTPKTCALACAANYYSFSGVEYGQECYCSDTDPVGDINANSDCDMLCTGDATIFCGAGNRINVYNTTLTGTPVVVAPIIPTSNTATQKGSFVDTTGRAVSVLGCYVDSASIDGQPRTLPFSPLLPASIDVTAESCALSCANLGYQYSGVEYTWQCYCGRSLDSTLLASDPATCNMACAGDATELCGGPWRLNVYQTAIGASSGIDLGATYEGCYADSVSSRTYPWTITSIGQSDMTPAACITACASASFNFAGLEYSQECYCGLALPSLSDKQIDDTSCDYSCNGDPTLFCGGSNRLSIYAVAST